MTVQDQFILKPRKTGEILDQGVRLYRRNFLTFIGIIAVVLIPMTLINGFNALSAELTPISPGGSGDPEMAELIESLNQAGSTSFANIASLILISGFGTAAMTRAVADTYLGRKTSIKEAYQRITKSWLSLLGALIIASIFTTVLALTLLIPIISWIIVPGMVVFLAFMVNVLIAPVVVTERLPASKAFRRAWDLAKRRFWWLLGFMIILNLLNAVLMIGPEIIFNILLGGTIGAVISGDLSADPNSTRLVVDLLVNMVVSLLYLPLQTTCITLAYFDLRVRLEGFDLAMMAAEGQEDVSDVAESAPKVAVGKFLTWGDIGRFVALSIVAILFFLMFGAAIAGFL